MPTRLMVVLLVCLPGPVADCATPFMGSSRQRGELEAPARRQFMEPLALPIVDDVVHPLWPQPAERGLERPTGSDHLDLRDARLADPRTARLRTIPSLSANSNRVVLKLETAGLGRWDSALVELWITRDGWNWHPFFNAPLCESLAVAFPGEGRYGLRVVVHRLGGLGASTPRVGDLPQAWIEVARERSVVAMAKEVYCSPGRLLHSSPDLDQPADVKQVARTAFAHPCGYVKRIEYKVPVNEEEPRPSEPGFVFPMMSGWTR